MPDCGRLGLGTDSDRKFKPHSDSAEKFEKEVDFAVVRCDDGFLSARDRKDPRENAAV